MIRIRAAAFAVFAGAALPAAAQAPAAPPASEAAQIISVIEHACMPLIGGAKPAAIGPQLGMRANRDGDLVMSLEGPEKITLTPPNEANPTLCTLTVLYDVGADGAIYDALNGWARARATPYEQRRTRDTSQVDNETHITSTWAGAEGAGTGGLVLIQAKRADGRPLGGRAEQATILFSVTPN